MKRDGNSGEAFIARCLILSSRAKDGVSPNAPGDVVGHICILSGANKNVGLSKTKTFVLSAVGVKEAEITGEQFIETFEDAINYVPNSKSEYNQREIKEVQALRGMLINFDSYDQQTKAQKASGSKETNTYMNFTHVPDQGDIEARRKELDKTHPLQGSN